MLEDSSEDMDEEALNKFMESMDEDETKVNQASHAITVSFRIQTKKRHYLV